jgi:hypothetical protein
MLPERRLVKYIFLLFRLHALALEYAFPKLDIFSRLPVCPETDFQAFDQPFFTTNHGFLFIGPSLYFYFG